MKRIFFTILIGFFVQNSFAQEIVSEEHREMIVKFIYGIDTEIFKTEERQLNTEVYNPEDYFSNILSNEEVEACFNLMNKTAKIEFGGERIYFVANILTSLNTKELKSSGINVWKHENRLFYGEDTLKIQNAQGSGNRFGNDYYQITRNYPLDSEQTDTTKIRGSLVMKVEFLTGYDSISLKKNDIDKEFKLADETLKIINIIGDAIVLKGNSENVNVINFVSDNDVAKPLALLDGGDLGSSFTLAIFTTYKSLYENLVLKKMSFEEFDKLMTIDKLNDMQHDERYRIIKNVAKIGDKFILYKPIYRTYFLTVNYQQ